MTDQWRHHGRVVRIVFVLVFRQRRVIAVSPRCSGRELGGCCQSHGQCRLIEMRPVGRSQIHVGVFWIVLEGGGLVLLRISFVW